MGLGRKWRKLRNVEFNYLYLLTKCCSGDKIEKNEIGRTRSTYEGEERHIQGFGGEI